MVFITVRRCFYSARDRPSDGCRCLEWLVLLMMCSLWTAYRAFEVVMRPTRLQCADNLAGIALTYGACDDNPIDVVYTWVNGSDPEFQMKLSKTKEHFQRPIASDWRQTCALADCLPAPLVTVVPPLPGHLSLGEVHQLIGSAAPIAIQKSPLATLPASLLHYSGIDDARQVLKKRRVHVNNVTHTLLQTFWTSSGSDLAPFSIRADELSLSYSNISGLLAAEASSKKRADNGSVLPHPKGVVQDESKSNTDITRPRLVLQLTKNAHETSVWPSRFTDHQELLFSMRSLEKNAPWVRRVFLVTNGQIPDWLNLDNDRLTLVTQEEIFPNHSHLPTFSSPAIECHLHRIAGLSERFLYMNDDFMFGLPVWPQDFISDEGTTNVYVGGKISPCKDDCDINTLDTFESSLRWTDEVLSKKYGKSSRHYIWHTPYFLQRSIIRDMQTAFSKEIEQTSSTPIRTRTDMQFSFLYFYFLMSERQTMSGAELFDAVDADRSGIWSDEEIKALLLRLRPLPHLPADTDWMKNMLSECSRDEYPSKHLQENGWTFHALQRANMGKCRELLRTVRQKIDKPRYAYHAYSTWHYKYLAIKSDRSQVFKELQKLRQEPGKFICFNDVGGHSDSKEAMDVYGMVQEYLQEVYPRPSQFELPAVSRNRLLKAKELRRWNSLGKSLLIVACFVTVYIILTVLAKLVPEQVRFLRILRILLPRGRKEDTKLIKSVAV